MKRLLEALYEQQYEDFEIIVVDDRSDFNEHTFFYKQQHELGRIKLVRVEQTPQHISHKKYALTLGVRAAQHEHLLFTDADCLPRSPHWIQNMMQAFKPTTNIVLGVSPYERKPSFLNYIIRNETFYTALQYLSFKLVGLPYMGVGRNLAYKKSLFLKEKGFASHQEIVGGDDDLFVNQVARKGNTAICIKAEGQMMSIPKTTWSEWQTQKIRHLSVGKYYKWKHKLILGLYNLTHIGFWLTGVASLVSLTWVVSPWMWLIVGAFSGRFLLKNIILSRIALKMHMPNKWYELFLFDCLYCFYILLIGVRALFTKTAKWS